MVSSDNHVYQSSLCHELEHGGRFAKFKLPLILQNAWDMAQSLESLSYKVCSTLSPRFVTVEPSLLILGKSANLNQCVGATL